MVEYSFTNRMVKNWQSSKNTKIQKHFCKTIYSKLFRRLFVIKKIKNTVPSTYVTNDFNGEEITGTFY